MKYSKKIADKIIELLEAGKHNISDICEMVGINKQTFYNWKANPKIDFLDRLELAEEKRLDAIKERAISGLYKLVDIYEFEEVKTEYIPNKADPTKPVIKAMSKVKKVIMPSQKAIDFALNNLYSDKFKNRTHVDHTNNGEAFDFSAFLMNHNTVPDDETDGTGEDTSEQQKDDTAA